MHTSLFYWSVRIDYIIDWWSPGLSWGLWMHSISPPVEHYPSIKVKYWSSHLGQKPLCKPNKDITPREINGYGPFVCNLFPSMSCFWGWTFPWTLLLLRRSLCSCWGKYVILTFVENPDLSEPSTCETIDVLDSGEQRVKQIGYHVFLLLLIHYIWPLLCFQRTSCHSSIIIFQM